MKHLIVTGDDFGVNHRVNEAVERAHRAGLLTQASLIVHGAALDEAVRIAKNNPRLCVGLHLDLLAHRTPARAGLHYFFSRCSHAGLREEIARQFEEFAELGFAPEYWDGHTHLHLHPTIFKFSLPIAKNRGFRATRLVREFGSIRALPLIFRALSGHAAQLLAGTGILSADRTIGLVDSGKFMTRTFLRALEQVEPGKITELYFHPGVEPEDLEPNLILEMIEVEEIQLVSWRDLNATKARSAG
jgi:predicted glycoside hydrolase/deacetylase ChbG (UPF0249 family)